MMEIKSQKKCSMREGRLKEKAHDERPHFQKSLG